MKSVRTWMLFALAALGLATCKPAHSPTETKSPPPAKVQQYSSENSLATVTLTAEAEKRLGIVTVAVERKKVTNQRSFGGEVVLPPGRAATVSAPLGGTILSLTSSTESVVVPGKIIKKGQPVFLFLPLLSPERAVLTPSERVRLAEAKASLASSRVEAQGRVESAKVEIQAAEIEVQRAEQLLREKFGTARVVDEAKTRLAKAQKELEVAVAREALFRQTILDAEAGTLTPTAIGSPQDGVLSNLFVTAGQTVAAGTALFEVVKQDLLWIRVPVYVGDVERIDTEAQGLVGSLAGPPTATAQTVRPIAAPPSANPGAATVDLYYEMENAAGKFRPGQRVAVALNLRGQEESLVVPWSAILHDIHGGTWVYRKVKDLTFSRNRVQVRRVVGGLAILAEGPEPGTLVVTDGAAELFGTEFGTGK